MALLGKHVTYKDPPQQGPGRRPIASLGERAIAAIVTERARFHRFIASRIGDDAIANDLLQESLLRALQRNGKLRRGESAVGWFYRNLSNAITDHSRKFRGENRPVERLLQRIQEHAQEEGVSKPPPDWNVALCACLRGLLPSVDPRYAQVIRRVELHGEPKRNVAGEMKLSAATMDVLLHRARRALRKRLEILCASSSHESRLRFFSGYMDRSRKIQSSANHADGHELEQSEMTAAQTVNVM
jgi:RNA polymerase sigma factor (sigma-70 family)